MLEPLLLNTLEEAADWLTEKTKTKVTYKHILSAEIRRYKSAKPFIHSRPPKSIINIALPRDTEFSMYGWVDGDGFVFKHYASWMLVPLYLVHLWELLIHGETKVSIAQYPDDQRGDGESYIFVGPVLKGCNSDMSMVRIKGNDLKELVSQFNTDDIKLTMVQEDKLTCQSIAKKIWEDNPNYTQVEVKKQPEVFAYTRKYKGKNTVSNWLSEVDPRPKNIRSGRPKK